jgi:hypothetical protein
MAITGTGLAQVWQTALTADDATAKEPLGAIRIEHDATKGDKVYMYVLASGAIANGSVCVFNGLTGYTVGVNTTALIGTRAAVGVGIGTITTGQYGWIQIRGHHTAIIKAATGPYCTTAYTEMFLTSGECRSAKYKNTTSWITASTYFIPAGITAYESKATSVATLSGFIHCM